jgi:flotillin
MLFWNVPAPDQALLISGSRHKDPSTQFRIVTGHGSFVMPIKQKARFLSLALREAEVSEDCVTSQGIPLQLIAVAFFKVGDDSASIANAARRFLDEQGRMEELCGRIFAGHLRSIVGALTVEQIIRERDRVATEVREGSQPEMEKLGIVVDGFQIQEIGDPSGYIQNIAAPHAAAVASQARIAAAERDQEASEKEQEAARAKAGFARETSIQKARIAAEVEQAQAETSQAGPLAQARASQQVIAEQTTLAERNAALKERQLEVEVRRPADAEAYRQKTLAAAALETTKLEADGEAYAALTTAEADAKAITARAGALSGENQRLIAANTLVEMLPELVAAAAQGIDGSKLTILNGAQGLTEFTTGLAAEGLTIYDALRRSLAAVTAPDTVGGAGPASGREQEAVSRARA